MASASEEEEQWNWMGEVGAVETVR